MSSRVAFYCPTTDLAAQQCGTGRWVCLNTGQQVATIAALGPLAAERGGAVLLSNSEV